jgi:hypothetical protein
MYTGVYISLKKISIFSSTKWIISLEKLKTWTFSILCRTKNQNILLYKFFFCKVFFIEYSTTIIIGLKIIMTMNCLFKYAVCISKILNLNL